MGKCECVVHQPTNATDGCAGAICADGDRQAANITKVVIRDVDAVAIEVGDAIELERLLAQGKLIRDSLDDDDSVG